MSESLKLLSAGALEGLLSAMLSEFSGETGIAVSLSVATIGLVQSRLAAGERADVVIMSPAAIAAMETAGTVLPGSGADICRAEAGLGVPAGTPHPDVGTPQALRQALIAARSITATDPKAGGTAGMHFARLLADMGIAETVADKLMLWDTGRAVVESIARGRAELGVTFISELMLDPAIAVVGPLPPPMRLINTYTAAVVSMTGAVEPARRLMAFLTGARIRARLPAFGLLPPRGFDTQEPMEPIGGQ